jgi:HK97 family phage prohead protease
MRLSFEHRHFPAYFREGGGSGGGGSLSARLCRGYAAVFYVDGDRGTEFQLAPGIVEQIAPDAFDGAMARGDDVRLLRDHDPTCGVLARTAAGTLKLSLDDIGLAWQAELPSTSLGEDLVQELSLGSITQCSFSFQVDAQDWIERGDSVIRLIRSVTLYDVSLVAFPAYEATTASLVDRFGDPAPKVSGGSLPRCRRRASSRWARDRASQVARDLVRDRARHVCQFAGIRFPN